MSEFQSPFFSQPIPIPVGTSATLESAYRMEESICIQNLLTYLAWTPAQEQQAHQLAAQYVTAVRHNPAEKNSIEALMSHYDLSTDEGILLMCLAEALLRVPDKATVKLLIEDKLTSADWEARIATNESRWLQLMSKGLVISGKILQPTASNDGKLKNIWQHLIKRVSEPVIRRVVYQVMNWLGEQFVMGETIEEAIKRSHKGEAAQYRYSYDMLGEVARTQADADRYFEAYFNAISALGKSERPQMDWFAGPSISVKLSALHPRYQFTQRERVLPELTERLKKLALHAKSLGIGLTVDAEEADRLTLSLDILQSLWQDPELKAWDGLGLAVQAYQRRAFYLIDLLIDVARRENKKIPVRLVKGAYWDSEIKFAQVQGYADYPVFTRKINTDVSYLACAKKMLSAPDALYLQFATHNAYSVAAILTMMGRDRSAYQFEFQCLQGMGNALYHHLINPTVENIACRVYAPVGRHEDLLPYLVRRLLENGANSSFVNQIADERINIDELIASPITKVQALTFIANPKIPLPKDLYGAARLNSAGVDFSDLNTLMKLNAKIQALPKSIAPTGVALTNPANRNEFVGRVCEATVEDVDQAIQLARQQLTHWQATAVKTRADILRTMADNLEQHQAELMYLIVREAGKNWFDAIAEIREAVDFCRYYAQQAEITLADQVLPGPTGESNVLSMRGRGIILCISPWNFPLAIFAGQIAAALVAGNAVIAKPAEQTPLIAARAVELFIKAGIPTAILQLLPGRGEVIGAALTKNPNISGVMFTGSNATAQIIQQTLANRPGPIVPFIAETGGINAMIADSTALPEQLVRDALISAFGSAGQRCSALRLLVVQEEIADAVVRMLAGAMAELVVGDPMRLATDVGPVIDADAKQMLDNHVAWLETNARLIYRINLMPDTQHGSFVAPCAYELASIAQLNKEIFGPILHVVRYAQKDLPQIVEQINALGYGLTFGIQSRIDRTVEYLVEHIEAGNIYVNRNMIGAVVGVQPFGGCRLSGTGPKAGGPHYLTRLCEEVTVTVDTTAAGGNASLMAMAD